MISHRKSTEVINITWFGHTGFLLFKKRGHKTDIFPALQKLTHMFVSIISEGITFPGQHTWTQVLPADRACHDSGEGAPCRTHLCQQVSVINIQLLKSTWSVRWSVRVDIFIHHGRHCLCVEKSEHGGFNGWIEMGSKPPEPRNQYDFFQNLIFALRKQISA